MIDLTNGIYQLDANYIKPGVAALYLLQQGNECAIIETGTNYSLPQILQGLERIALGVDNVRYVIPTHVHLDHAGGAGQLMKLCSNAELIIHPFGAQHMINPSRLIEGTKGVYGAEKFHKFYGDIVPIAEERIITAPDNFTLTLNERKLLFIDTPGHASHHFCIYDEQSNGVFAGDTMGISYPPLSVDNVPFIFATTTPVQFHPLNLLTSIDKICTLKPQQFFLTHFGQVSYSADLITQLKHSVETFRDIALAAKDEPVAKRLTIITDNVLNAMVKSLQNHGSTLSTEQQQQALIFDATINAQGLNVWLDRLKRQQ